MSSSVEETAIRAPGKKQLAPNVLLLGWVSLLTDVSSRMTLPILPLFLADTLGSRGKVIGIIEGLGVGVSWILKLFAGWLSDRWGQRKPFILWGYLLSNLAKPLLAFVTHWSHALLLRSGDKFGSGLRDAPRDVLIADSAGGKTLGRAFGYQKFMDKVGALLGTALAFALLASTSETNYRPIFL
ncbi:MAG: MFS transporter, partial [Candidatus Binatia bacterium]|nr:MFS transporter [Candidatus Binatia bacterium]